MMPKITKKLSKKGAKKLAWAREIAIMTTSTKESDMKARNLKGHAELVDQLIRQGKRRQQAVKIANQRLNIKSPARRVKFVAGGAVSPR